MPRPGGARDAVEVVLEGEAGEPAPEGQVTVAGPGSPGGPGRARSARRRLGAGVLVAVLALVVAVNVVERRGEAAREARLADLPGVVADLSAPLRRAWQVEGPVGGAVAGHLVLLQQPFRSDRALRAVDLRTGEVRWSKARTGPDGVLSCTGEASATTVDVVVCWARTGPPLLVVDAADGRVRARHPVPPPTLGHAVVGDDVLLVDRAGDVLVARRVALGTGRERWRTTVDVPGRLRGRGARPPLVVRHGLLVVEDATTVVLDASTGEVLGRWASPDAGVTGLPGADVVPLPDGAFVVRSGTAGSRAVRAASGVVHHADGRRVPVEGVVAETALTDGSAGHVLLLEADDGSGPALVGVDVRSGHERWRMPATAVGDGGAGVDVLLRADGAAVTAVGTTLAALDAASGDVLWRAGVPGLRTDAGCLTDGARVLVAALVGRTWELVALDLGDGHLVWRAPSPGPLGTGADRLGGTGGLQAPAGAPVLVAPTTLTGLAS